MTNDILNIQLQALVSSPTISANAISAYKAVANSTTKGVDVSFALTNATGVNLVSLLRNYSQDVATATVLQSWVADVSSYTWSDTDAGLQTNSQAYYWVRLTPKGTLGKAVTVGPQQIGLNPQTIAPPPAQLLSVSHAAVLSGTVLVTANVSGAASDIKIYVAGYKGNAAYVAVAQSTQSPLQFALQQTGETITIKAINVSAGGTESLTGPTALLTLDTAATVPATPQNVSVTQAADGNHITFQANKDAVTGYIVLSTQRGLDFSTATVLATIQPNTAQTISYIDPAGLMGDWAYYIEATNATGNSAPSLAASPFVILSSAALPTNAQLATNTAQIDSIDGGTSAIIRVYGSGGVGTSYTRVTGYGTFTRPAGSLTGLAYNTLYYVMYTGNSYTSTTDYPSTLSDGYEYVGEVVTLGQSGAVGSGATASVVLSQTGQVLQVNATSPGSGYSAAAVQITGGNGAQIQANITNGQVTSYTVLNGGSGYTATSSATVTGMTSTGQSGGGGATGGAGGARGGSGGGTGGRNSN